MLRIEFVAGAQEKMVGVGQQDADAEIFGEIALGQSFDGGLRADGHEDGRFDGAVGGVQKTGAGAGVGALGHHFEGDLSQINSLQDGGEGVASAPDVYTWK